MKALLAFIAVVGCASMACAADITSVKVKILDGFGGDSGSVLMRCQTKAGMTYDPVVLTRDVTALRKSSEFEEINADANRTATGVEVTFFVKRKMRYCAPLVIEGADALSESKISSESELKDGFLYGEADIAAAAAKVRRAYLKKHYPDAKVNPITEPINGNDVRIKFVIVEGECRKVSDYRFANAPHLEAGKSWWNAPWWEPEEGNVSEADVREAIGDYPWWNPIGWFSDEPITRDQLAQCCDKVAKFYRDNGYLDVKVTGPKKVVSEKDSEKSDVVFDVQEGARYVLGTTTIRGVTRYPVEVVREKSALPVAGVIAGEKTLEDAAHRIKVTVGSGDSGLADTRVDVKCIPVEGPQPTVNVVFQVTEGVPVVLNEVKIRGNDYTKDKVIRREIALGPGDRMLEDRAERSQKRLENLDYFSRVRYYLEPTDKGKNAEGQEYRNLVYEVEEKNTGSFMVGIGASSVDSVYVSAEVNQNNFDLFAPSKLFRGAGQKGRVYVAWGPRYQSAEIGFVEPHLFGRMLELSVDLYRRLRWYDQYDLIRTGANVAFTYPVKFWPTWSAFGRFGIGISGEYIQFDDVDEGYYTYENRKGQLFREEEDNYGDAFEPVLHFFWAKDSRDNFRIPTKGHRTKVYLDVAPACDNKYWRLGLVHSSYFTTWKRFGHVFMGRLRAETIDAFSDDVPIYNRMFLGGPKSIRGIEYRNVAPMARSYNPYTGMSGNGYAPWGGQTLFCMNFEYTVPIIKMFRIAAFSDLGAVGVDNFDLDFSDCFAWTVGLGARLDIPMFPIRLDFGFPIVLPSEAEEEIFSFTVGYDF